MEGLREALAAMGRVVRNPEIARALLAWMAGNAAEWAWLVALYVYAYDAGGLAVVGLVGLARNLPAGILAPALGTVTDRFSRRRVLLAVNSGRFLLLSSATLAAILGWPPIVVYVIASVDGLLAVLRRPAYMSMLPSLARAPDELVGANVASSTVESIGILGGPVLGGALVATGSTPLAFAAPAALVGIAVLSISRARPARPLRPPPRANVADTLFGGLRASVQVPHVGELLGLFASQTLVRGILSVLIVAGAVELLGMGQQGVGYLNAAIGAGGLFGAIATVVLVGRSRLAPGMFGGLLLWGLPILVVGLVPVAWVGLVALAAVGVGNALVDVAGFSLMQRIVPNEVRGRVFAVLESLVMLTVGIGSVLAPALVGALGVRGAWIATGAFLPTAAIIGWRAMAAADRQAVIPERELALLRAVPMLRVLPMTVLEQLAADLVPMHFAAGETVIRQGDVGDRFYIIESGAVEVRVGPRVVARLDRAGESFGEFALLRDVPRTAGVMAATDLETLTLNRIAFVCAVSGDRQSERAAEEVIEGLVR
jgi:MFS family permease